MRKVGAVGCAVLVRRRGQFPVPAWRVFLSALLGWTVAVSLAAASPAPRQGVSAAPDGSSPFAPPAEAVAAGHNLPLHATVITSRLIGSAFEIAPGLAVTAAHVVEGMPAGSRVILRRGPSGGPTVSARLLGLSATMDLAVLEVPLGFLPTIGRGTVGREETDGRLPPATPAAGTPLVASGSVPARDPVVAVPRRVSGTASGRNVDVAGLGPGFVASLPGTVPGFSGGPVIDMSGRLAGMIVAIRRLPAAGRPDAPVGRSRLSDEVYVLAADSVMAEARRIAERSPFRHIAGR